MIRSKVKYKKISNDDGYIDAQVSKFSLVWTRVLKLEANWEDQNIIQIYGVDRRLNYTSKVGYATIIWYAFVSKYTELR